jgi:hypothetical protein
MDYYPLDKRTSAITLADQFGGGRPLTRLLLLAWNNGARFALLEPAQDCDEWNDEKALFYGSIASHVAGEATRLHLTTTLPETDEEFASRGESACVGHVVVRPSPLSSVAEAMVPPAHGSGHHFLTCAPDRVPASFMQQDMVVSRCAHACVWMATQLLSRRFPPSEVIGAKKIDDALKGSDWGMPLIPSQGLHQLQISHVLSQHGYRTLTYDFESVRDERGEVRLGDHVVYRYVESGIPVILGIETERERHALVVVGHSFDADAWWPSARAGYFPQLSSGEEWIPSAFWANDYICHDDNLGPYLNLSRGSVRSRTTELIVAIPEHIGMLMVPEEAELKAAGFLFDALRSPFAHSKSRWQSNVYAWAAQGQLVLRTILIGKDELSAHLAEVTDAAEISTVLSESLLARDWTWMVEISSPELFGDHLKYGEVFIDPTIPPLFPSPTAPLLAVHLPGYVLARDAAGNFEQHYLSETDLGLVHKRPSLSVVTS